MGGITGGSDENGEHPRDDEDASFDSEDRAGTSRPRPRPSNTDETTQRPVPAPETNQLSYWQKAAAGPEDRTSQVDYGYGGYGGYSDQPPPPPPPIGYQPPPPPPPPPIGYADQPPPPPPIGYGDQPPPPPPPIGYGEPIGYGDQPPPMEPTEFNVSRSSWAEPERPRRDSSNLALWVALAALLVVVAGGIVVVTVLHSSSKSTAGKPNTAVSPVSTASSATTSSVPASSAATPSASGNGLAGGNSAGATAPSTGLSPAGAANAMSTADQIDNLLDQSSAARAGVRPSLNAIRHCSADDAAIATLQSASSTRQALLSQLGSVRFDLLSHGATLRTELSELLTYSYEADDAYAAWGTDNLNCQDLAPYDGDYKVAAGYSAQATSAKRAFIGNWNPVARQYGLQPRTESTI